MDENGFVVIRENNYAGYGFAPTDVAIEQIEDLEMFITPQNNTLETQRIVESYVRNNPTAVFAL